MVKKFNIIYVNHSGSIIQLCAMLVMSPPPQDATQLHGGHRLHSI